MSSRWPKIVAAMIFLLNATVLISPQIKATGDGYLQISPPNGGPQTEIHVSVDVYLYILNELPNAELQEYVGLNYKVVWDAGGWPEPFKYPGNLWSQTTWKVIGNAVIDIDGVLRGTATIPKDWEIEDYGEHWIFVLWEGAIDVPIYTRAWWWTGFAVEEIDGFLPTDLNMDGAVNIFDITMVAKAFGSRHGDLNWNDLADRNGDGVVSILDISIIAKDFGKTF